MGAGARHRGLRPVGADVCRLPFADQSFDLVLSNSTLDHLESLSELAGALAELRRVAGTQLDPAVVDVFVEMILERGIAFRHSDEVDFESELAFDRRVDDYARPRTAAA